MKYTVLYEWRIKEKNAVNNVLITIPDENVTNFKLAFEWAEKSMLHVETLYGYRCFIKRVEEVDN
jgi:hypothetical protein